MANVYSEGYEYHIKIPPGQAGRYVTLPGDSGRCRAIAKYLDDAKLVSSSREYVTYTGTLCGERVSATPTGINGSSTVVALEELVHCGADTFTRMGTSGGMRPKVLAGDLVVTTEVVRTDGTGREYAPVGYLAVAYYDVVEVLKHTGEALGRTIHIDVVQCKDSLYGQYESESMPISREPEVDWEARKYCGALTLEMESATLFIVDGVCWVRVGMVLLVIDSQTRHEMGLEDIQCHDTTWATETTVEATKLLITRDKRKNEGKQL